MLIHLDPSAISSAIADDKDSDTSLRCIERLLERHHDGHHILSIMPEDARRLRASQAYARLSGHHRDTLARIHARFADTAYLREELWRHLVLGLGPGFDDTLRERAVFANLHRFYALDSSGRAVLLCENATDADFYLAIGRLVVHRRKWNRKLRLHGDPRSGGGSQLGRELTRIAGEGRILLAIVDSDRKCALGSQGSTATLANDAARHLPPFQEAHVLRTAREAENLVPLDVYRDVFEHLGKREAVTTASLLRSLSEAEIRHADLKEGITLYQIDHRMERGSREHETWLGLARRRGRAQCQRPGSECGPRRQCECVVVEKLGSAVLESVVAWLNEAGMQSPRQTGDGFGLPAGAEAHPRPEIAEIAEKVIAWSCAYPRGAM